MQLDAYKTLCIRDTQNAALRARSCAYDHLIFADFCFSICVNVHYIFARELYFYLTQSGTSASGESIAPVITARERLEGYHKRARTE